MRTTDNLAKGTSYFHAELLRLQQLVQTAEQSQKTFCILDEMLKGTNSQDKLNGSRKFLHKLQTLPVAGLVATHDLARRAGTAGSKTFSQYLFRNRPFRETNCI